MATRSNIGMKQEDGTIKTVYCHWDGYPEGVGATLAEHYTTRAKVEELLNLGDFSNLAENVAEIETYAQRGETGTEARTYQDKDEWRDDVIKAGIEFLYLLDRDGYTDRLEWTFYSEADDWQKLSLIQRASV